MATYLVTGATTLLGRLLVERLLARPDCTGVQLLVRAQAAAQVRAEWASDARLSVHVGELTEPGLGAGLAAPDHLVQLSSQGTSNVLDFAADVRAGLVHLLAPAADDDRLARAQRAVPARVYRHSVLLGDSRTGEQRAGHPLLPVLSRLSRLPSRLPLLGADFGQTNVVPVDYVADAIAYLMHENASPGTTYHLAAPEPQPVNEVYNTFAVAAGAPRVVATAPKPVSRRMAALAAGGTRLVDRVPGLRASRRAVLEELGLSRDALAVLKTSVLSESAATRDALAGSGLSVPPLDDYAGRLYEYWRGRLDPDRARRGGPGLTGRTVLITGASSGIGRETALRVARRGGIPLLVARRADQLAAVRDEIVAAGGTASVYPCDLTDGDAVDAVVKQVLAEHGAVDVLVNNAGRSIRRPVFDATDRLHDYERTMAVNYFAAVRLTLGLLPVMRARRHGHVVNVTTQGIQNHTPRFSAYLASKAALEEFGLVAGRETLSHGITFSSVKLPLVSTEMTAPSEKFNAFGALPMMDVNRAAGLVMRAILRRPETVNLVFPAGVPAVLASLFLPKTTRALTHLVAFEGMPDGASGRGRPMPRMAAAVTRMLWR
ncbi:SDR family NAD(P)-dependent oxidoreductase [Amycolatopsis nigrescens]|uniref:SDR family NAD(P)-dependent oxidoreductase n=1 Tax=Amycolatopsis nigrescens TaxID=381445 RepID=UPI0003720B10|nr:SDR family NAD(P)-dependent oxidoreductase [Amycolatopsis nigrescens]